MILFVRVAVLSAWASWIRRGSVWELSDENREYIPAHGRIILSEAIKSVLLR